MASVKDTAIFFTEGTASQFQHVLSLYPQVLKLKAESKNKKPEDLIKLDNWYQNELPKKIKSRGKDAHCNHEELVQLMKWKQTRGKFYPQLNYLVKVNTPRAVLNETKKAFRKLPNLEQAITALSNLKGVGTTLASALLAAAAPDIAPFMAEECLKAIPEIESIDYTTREYLNFVSHIQNTKNRLSKESTNSTWSLHSIELALWTHFVASELKPELLDSIPCANGSTPPADNTTSNIAVNVSHQNGDISSSPLPKSSENDADAANDSIMSDNLENTSESGGGANTATVSSTNDVHEEETAISSVNEEDSLDKASSVTGNDIVNDDDVTNDSIITTDSATNDSLLDADNKQNNDDDAGVVLNINEETCSSFLEPPNKKAKFESESSVEAADLGNSQTSSAEDK